MENRENCVLCCKPLRTSEFRRGADEHYKKLIKCCEKFLQDECTDELTDWTFCEGSPLPFCIVCFTSSEKLVQVEQELEELCNYLEECVNTFSTEIRSSKSLYSQKNKNVANNGQNGSKVGRSKSQVAIVVKKSHNSFDADLKHEALSFSDVADEDSNCHFQDLNAASEVAVEKPSNPIKTTASSRFRIIKTSSPTTITKNNVSADIAKSNSIPNCSSKVGVNPHNSQSKKLMEVIERIGIPLHSEENAIFSQTSSNSFQDNDGKIVQMQTEGERNNSSQTINPLCNTEVITAGATEECSLAKRRKMEESDEFPILDLDDLFSDGGGSGVDSDQNQISANESFTKSATKSISTAAEEPASASSIVAFKCSVCKKFLLTSKELDEHIEVTGHVPEHTEKLFQCSNAASEKKDNEHRKKYVHKTKSINYCKYCGMDFPISESYRNHMKKHNGRKLIYHCSLCEIKWTSMTALFRHMTEFHSYINPFNCSECDRIYYTKEAFSSHKYIHEQGMEQGYDPVDDPNQLIEWTFENIREIKERMFKPPVPLVKMLVGFKCDACDEYFEFTRGLDSHSDETGHMNEKTAQCKDCDRLFYRNRDVTHHLKECEVRLGLKNKEGENADDEDDDNEQPKIKTFGKHRKYYPFECCICKETFKLAMQLENHSETSGHVNERTYACTDCPRRYFRKKDLRDHKTSVHKSTHDQFTCELCGKLFPNKRCFTNHMKKHHGNKLQNTIRCSICRKVWVTIKQMHDHINKDHSEATPLKCDKCERQYYSQEKFNEHVKLHRDSISKNFVLEEPDQEKEWTWQNKEKYKKEKIPTSNKAIQYGFICVVCGQWFVLSKVLDKHAKNSGHINKRDVNCPKCPKLFYRTRDVASHSLYCKNRMEKPKL